MSTDRDVELALAIERFLDRWIGATVDRGLARHAIRELLEMAVARALHRHGETIAEVPHIDLPREWFEGL